MSTGTRSLELLGLLQNRRHWSGDELAHSLGVSTRTLRRAVSDLQLIGYPITTTRGTGGGYQLSPGAALPPLVLSEDEAAAVVMGLKEVAPSSHSPSGEAAVSAMAKLVQVLPSRIRRRIDSLRSITTARFEDRTVPIADVAALTTVALACRDHETLAFNYTARDGRASLRTVQPHKTVSVDRRLYLVAWDLDRVDWRTFRIDRITTPQRCGRTFAPRPLPAADPAEYVKDRIRSIPARFIVRATVHAPAERVLQEMGRFGTVTELTATSCTVRIGAASLDWATFCLAAIGAPFVVHGPPEAIDYVRGWGERLLAAADGTGSSDGGAPHS